MWQVIIITTWTAIAGIGGAYASKIFDKSFESRRWERDQRAAEEQWARDQEAATQRWVREQQAKAYDGYLSALQDLRQNLRRVAVLRDRDPIAWEKDVRDRRLSWATFNAALLKLEAYAPVEAYQAAQATREALWQLSDHVGSFGAMTDEEWFAARLPSDRLARAVVDAIRQELGLAELPSRESWMNTIRSAGEPDFPGEAEALEA